MIGRTPEQHMPGNRLNRRRFLRIGTALAASLSLGLLLPERKALASEQDFEKLNPRNFPIIDTDFLRRGGEDVNKYEPAVQSGHSWSEIADELGENALLLSQPQVGGESLSVKYDPSLRIRPDYGAYMWVNPDSISEEAAKPGMLMRFPGDEFRLGVKMRNLGDALMIEAQYLPNFEKIPDSHPKQYRYVLENKSGEPTILYFGVVQRDAREVRLIGNAEKAIYVPNNFHTSDGITTHLSNPSK